MTHFKTIKNAKNSQINHISGWMYFLSAELSKQGNLSGTNYSDMAMKNIIHQDLQTIPVKSKSIKCMEANHLIVKLIKSSQGLLIK